MTLSHDLIRDTLLYIEEHTTSFIDEYGTLNAIELSWNDVCSDEILSSLYSEAEIKYCISKLLEDDLIHAKIMRARGRLLDVDIAELTMPGHQLADNIRDKHIWQTISNKLGGIGKVSIGILAEVAKQVATSWALSQMGFTSTGT